MLLVTTVALWYSARPGIEEWLAGNSLKAQPCILEKCILKEKRNATGKNIIFVCLNDGLVKSLLEISY